MTSNRYYHGPVTDHFDGELFFNSGIPTTDRGVGDILRWRLHAKRAPWPKMVATREVIPAARVPGLSVTMIGHASVLIQVAGKNILVDPVWSERASPFKWLGPRRVTPPGVAFEKLPPIDLVLLTHNHYDHLDVHTIERLYDRHRPRIIAPLGNDAVIAQTVSQVPVETYDWTDAIELEADFTISLQPANHWSARALGDRRMALWTGFVLNASSGSVYVAGDTGYGDGRIFREVRRRHPSLDVAILPIGAYEPRWFMKDQHVNPDEAVQIMQDCGAKQALGIHWGTFQLTDESRMAPKVALEAALSQRGLSTSSFIALEPGDSWSMDGIGSNVNT